MMRLISTFIICSLSVMSTPVWAIICSVDLNRIVINEVNAVGGSAGDFVELYLNDNADLSVENWQLCTYQSSSENCLVLGAGSAYSEWDKSNKRDNDGPRYANGDYFLANMLLSYQQDWLASGGLPTSGTAEILLKDDVGNAIDYLCYSSGTGCNSPYWSVDSSCKTALNSTSIGVFKRATDGSGSLAYSADSPAAGQINTSTLACGNMFADAITTHGSSGKILMAAHDPSTGDVAPANINAEQRADINNSVDYDFAANSIMYRNSGFGGDPATWSDTGWIPSTSRMACDSADVSSAYDCDNSTTPETALTLPAFLSTTSDATLKVTYNWGASEYQLTHKKPSAGIDTTSSDTIFGNDVSENECEFSQWHIETGGTLQIDTSYCTDIRVTTLKIDAGTSNGSTLIMNSANLWVENWVVGDGLFLWGASPYSTEPGDVTSPNIVKVAAGEKLTLYLGNDTDIKTLNMLNGDGLEQPNPAGQLLIFAYGKLTLKPGSQISGLVYSDETVYLESGASTSRVEPGTICDPNKTTKAYFDRCNLTQIWGGVTAQNIAMAEYTSITYMQGAVNASAAGAFCGGGASSAVDHFKITPAVSQTNACDGAINIQIDAVDNTGAIVTDYTGTINLDAIADGAGLQGTWGAQGGAAGSLSLVGTGEASFSYALGDSGSALLTLLVSDAQIAASPDVININVVDASDGTLTESSGVAVAGDDPDITFNECAASFAISLPASSVACQGATVQLSALDDSGNVLTSYDEAVTISTSTGNGDWAKTATASLAYGTLTAGAADSGSASYQFVTTPSADSGQIELQLSNSNVESLTVTVAQSSDPSITSTSSTISFNDAGFILIDSASGLAVSNQAVLSAGVISPQYEWWAVKTNTTTKACESYFSAGASIDLSISSACINPATCIAGQQAQLSWNDNSSFSAIANAQNLISGSAVVTETLVMDANSETPAMYLKYFDVGEFQVGVSHTLANGNVLTGSQNWVVAPYQLQISSVDANPAASAGTLNASVGKFVKAGVDFDLSIQALALAANGVDTQTAANFGNESSAQSFVVSQSFVAPSSPASTGTFTTGSWSAVSGEYQLVDSNFSEVGIIELSFELQNYLGQAAADVSQSQNVGRFYPAYFSISHLNNLATPTNSIAFANANSSCSSPFTYQGQAVSAATNQYPILQITAKNAAGTTTQNYSHDANWWKLTGSSLDVAADLSLAFASGFTTSGGVSNTSSGTASFTRQSAGLSTVSSIGIGALFNKSTTPTSDDGSKAIELDLTYASTAFVDSDGVCLGGNQNEGTCTNYGINNVGGVSLSYGRVVLENTFGSELQTLYMPMKVQYFDANQGFLPSTADDCSLALLNTGDVSVTDNDASDTLLASTALINSIASSSIVLDPSGDGKTGSMSLSLDLNLPADGANDLQHLKFDIDQNGSLDNPSATATYGIWQGRKRAEDARGKLLYIDRSFR